MESRLNRPGRHQSFPINLVAWHEDGSFCPRKGAENHPEHIPIYLKWRRLLAADGGKLRATAVCRVYRFNASAALADDGARTRIDRRPGSCSGPSGGMGYRRRMPNLPRVERGSAFFLDFDGTLADLAERPDAVRVEPGLVQDLTRLQRRCDGALAVVSGRPVAEIDRFLAPALLPVAGVHGAECRGAEGHWRHVPPPEFGAATAWLERWLAAHPQARLERKPGALALHYRGAEHLADACATAMQAALERSDGAVLLHGKCVIELKSAAIDKGRAVTSFMDEAPFAGRRPWCFGDDVTDEAAFAAVLALGGVAVKVGAGDTVAPFRIDSPARLRAWLRDLVGAGAPA
jgi:trehalose 6-phosphate phosphatase